MEFLDDDGRVVSNPTRIKLGLGLGIGRISDDLVIDFVGCGGWIPSQSGLLAGSGDPNAFLNGSAPAAGVVNLIKLWVPPGVTFASALTVVSTASSAENANTFMGVYGSTGVLLGKTAESSAAFRSLGAKTIALVAEPGQSLATIGSSGEFVYWAFLQGTAGVTPLQLARGTGFGGAANFGLSSLYRTATSGAGLAALPASIALGGISAATVLYLCGLQ